MTLNFNLTELDFVIRWTETPVLVIGYKDTEVEIALDDGDLVEWLGSSLTELYDMHKAFS